MAPPASCVALWIDCFFHFAAAAFFLLNGNPSCVATPDPISILELPFDPTATGEKHACVMAFHLYGMVRFIIALFSLSLTTGSAKYGNGAFSRRALVSVAIAVYHAVTVQYVSKGIVVEELKDSSMAIHGSLALILVAGSVAELCFGVAKSPSNAKQE